jgi:hypothetical protein
MKKILLAAMIFSIAGACLVPLRNATLHTRQECLASSQTAQAAAQRLAELQAELAVQEAKRVELQSTLNGSASTMDPSWVNLLLATNAPADSLDAWNRILTALAGADGRSKDYVIVSKAALAQARLKPLAPFPHSEKLTDAVRGVLAITPDEEQSLETAFSEAFQAVGAWARANVRREGPDGDMLVRYTIPADPAFEQGLTNRLFTRVNSAIGKERGELMWTFFEYHRIGEDDAIADRTNILAIYRIAGAPGLGYRSGWRWENAEAINTYPEPIKPNRFRRAFYFVFPGGWQEVARREGFELPAEFNN